MFNVERRYRPDPAVQAAALVWLLTLPAPCGRAQWACPSGEKVAPDLGETQVVDNAAPALPGAATSPPDA